MMASVAVLALVVAIVAALEAGALRRRMDALEAQPAEQRYNDRIVVERIVATQMAASHRDIAMAMERRLASLQRDSVAKYG